MLRVYMAVHDHDGLEEVLTLDQLKLNYATLVNCDPERDRFWRRSTARS